MNEQNLGTTKKFYNKKNIPIKYSNSDEKK